MKTEQEFWCETCKYPAEGKPGFTAVQIKQHLASVHKIKRFEARKKLLMAVDAEEVYQNTYEVKIGAVTLTQVVSGPRHGGGFA